MDELIRIVSQKVGISEAQARTAVTTVIAFLKERLPAPIAAQIEGVLTNTGTAGQLRGLPGKK